MILIILVRVEGSYTFYSCHGSALAKNCLIYMNINIEIKQIFRATSSAFL